MTIAQTPLKPESHPTEVQLDNGKKVVNTYDAIGRIASKALKNGNSTILNTEVTYYLGADGSKTALVNTYKNGSDIEYRFRSFIRRRRISYPQGISYALTYITRSVRNGYHFSALLRSIIAPLPRQPHPRLPRRKAKKDPPGLFLNGFPRGGLFASLSRPTFWSVAMENANKKPNKIKDFSISRGDFQPRVSFIVCDCSP